MGAIALSLSLGCGGSGGGGTGASSSGAATGGNATGGGGSATGGGGATCGPDVQAPEEELPGNTDPEMGDFTLDEALAELPEGPGPLRAIIDTDMGVITCTLIADMSPTAVANFAGLARGRRPWKDPLTGKWVKRRFYDGLTFHRVIAGFMAQGGDPKGNGTGGPGYKFDDEISGLSHVPGTLSYANSGADTNGSQFFITETKQKQLDAGFTIIGHDCAPLDVVVALTHVETSGPPNDKPLTPLHMKSIEITRCAP